MPIELTYKAKVKCRRCSRVVTFEMETLDLGLGTFEGNAREEFEDKGWAPHYDLCPKCVKEVVAEQRGGLGRRRRVANAK